MLAANPSKLTTINVTASRVQYRGRDAIKIVSRAPANAAAGASFNTIAVVPGADFRDGVIGADIAGAPRAGADTSAPEYPWYRLRKEHPGVYESYVDLEPGAWTPIRIEVRQGVAQLFVNGAKQPTLIIADMKNPPAAGRIALWIDADTEAHFSRLRVTPSR